MTRTEPKAKPEPEEPRRLRWHTVDYLERDGGRQGMLVHRGFWVQGLPRVMAVCRLRGHLPVVDGVGGAGERHGGVVARWVCCDRCGLRPEPQGSLDPAVWRVGQRIRGRALIEAVTARVPGFQPPGPWPRQPAGGVGVELVIGRSYGLLGAGVKVGNGGSEYPVAGHVQLNPLGTLYVNLEGFGRGVQRRLNPRGFESRVVDVSVHDGRAYWKVWAPRDSWTAGTPRWRDGAARLDPRDVLLGERRYTYSDAVGPVPGVVRMPDGDDHQVVLTLRRQRHGRRRGRGALSWSVDWESRRGIPIRNDSWKGNEVISSAVAVTDAAVEQGRWPLDACAAIAARISADRSRYGWRPPRPAEPDPAGASA